MKQRIAVNVTGLFIGIFFLAFHSGCDSTTSNLLEPAKEAIYYTDASGFASVPFSATFKPQSPEAVVNLTSIAVNLRDKWWIYHPADLEIFYRYGTPDEINDFGFLLNGPDEQGQYIVTGTMRLPIDNYGISTSCMPEGGGSFFSNGSQAANFKVMSGMNPQEFLGGTHSFDLPPLGSTVGKCFCMSLFSPFGMSMEFVIPTAMTPQGADGNGVAVPGWDDLDQSGVDLLFEDTINGFPAITADFLKALDPDKIVLDVHPDGVIDVDMPDPETWMELDMTLAGYDVYYICGFEYEMAGGELMPVTALRANLELTFKNIALKVALSRGGTCTLARADNILGCTPLTWNTPLDAMPECEVSAIYDGRNID